MRFCVTVLWMCDFHTSVRFETSQTRHAGTIICFLFLPRAKKKAVDAAVERPRCRLTAGVVWLQQKLLHWAYKDRMQTLGSSLCPLGSWFPVWVQPSPPPPRQHPETLPSLSAAEVISANGEVTSCKQGHLSARVFFLRHARTEIFAQFFWFITA